MSTSAQYDRKTKLPDGALQVMRAKKYRHLLFHSPFKIAWSERHFDRHPRGRIKESAKAPPHR